MLCVRSQFQLAEYSRFLSRSLDPTWDFERLYEIWIDRSTWGSWLTLSWCYILAKWEDPLGMVIGLRERWNGRIGLSPFVKEARGCGIGRGLLLLLLHSWITDPRGHTVASGHATREPSRHADCMSGPAYRLDDSEDDLPLLATWDLTVDFDMDDEGEAIISYEINRNFDR